MELILKSDAFEEGELIPEKYTCDGDDISPHLKWSQPPKETKSMVIICDDPDAPLGTWVHWVLYGIPPGINEIQEGIPNEREILGGAKHGINDFRKHGYGGPCPPGGTHRYFFKIYAVDIDLEIDAGASKEKVLDVIKGHIVAQGELMGRYSRK